MKKCLFILISLLSTGFAYAQLSMKVDSIDISKNIDNEGENILEKIREQVQNIE